jgi:hypothetical protein
MSDTERAYIAGFLDGDGSIILQIVRRHDYVLGFQIRATVCFYQKRCGIAVLKWIKERLGCGYIRIRGEMSDYAIVGFDRVRKVLELVAPFVVLKQPQVKLARQIICKAAAVQSHSDLVAVAESVDRFAALNYSKRRTVTADQVAKFCQVDNSRLS